MRRDEFDAILLALEKMNRRNKLTHLLGRMEEFIQAQGWGKKMEMVYKDLAHMRNGIETLVSNWGVVILVAKVQQTMTVDVTKTRILRNVGKANGKWNDEREDLKLRG